VIYILPLYLRPLKPLKIAYITETPVSDKHAWSGTAHYVYKALLQQGFTVEPLGPARPGLIRLLLAIVNKCSLAILKKRIDYRHSIIYSKSFGRIFSKKLERINYDLVVVCGGTEYGAYLRTSKPVYYVLDRTIAGALNYHLILKDLWEFSKKQSVVTDKKAMIGSRRVVFSSQWAANHAKQFYNLNESKIVAQPFGANMDNVPERSEALKSKEMNECRLLLVGTYWKNKGADIACNTLLELLKRGVNARLTVVGCIPPEPIQNDRLTVIPFIDKNSEEGLAALWKLFSNHHFFILPTRFDCTPIVFCEASAFGLPILSADTGGVEGHIKDGINGFLIPYEDKGKMYAQKIEEIFADKEKYQALCRSARNHYEQYLNWESWGRNFKRLIEADLN
jgi:glycosyltransferase involved in cell wall biosynthesis